MEGPRQAIYKYPLIIQDTQTLSLPRGARPISVGQQSGIPMLWAIVVTGTDVKVGIAIQIRGTGHTLDGLEGQFLGTIQMASGPAWHVFYRVL